MLLKLGHSGLIKGFKTKSGKKFAAFLELNRETGDVSFDFTSEVEKNLQCPFCHSLMNKSRYTFHCTNESCGFQASDEICRKRLTDAQITAVFYIDQADRKMKFEFQTKKDA